MDVKCKSRKVIQLVIVVAQIILKPIALEKWAASLIQG